MKIVIGSYFFPRGGSAHAVRATARGLSQRGLNVKVVSGSLTVGLGDHDATRFYGPVLSSAHDYTGAWNDWAAGGDAMASAIPMHGSYEIKNAAPDRDFSQISPVFARSQVNSWVRTLQALLEYPDVVHSHHLTPLTIAAQRVWPSTPILTTLHGTELKWLAREAFGSEIARFWSSLMLRAAASSEVLIALNARDALLAREILGTSARRIEVIGGGVDTEQFSPLVPRAGDGSSTTRSASGVNFICVARFIRAKRIPHLLRAWEIAERSAAFEGRLTIVGGSAGEMEGEDPYVLARRLALRRVVFKEAVPQHRLPAMIREADVFVLPSVGESFGQVFFEALACGIPIIACRSGAPGELLEPLTPQLGWFSEPDDIAALAANIRAAAGSAPERTSRGRAGRLFVVNNHTWDHVLTRLIGVYDSLQTGPTRT